MKANAAAMYGVYSVNKNVNKSINLADDETTELGPVDTEEITDWLIGTYETE